MWALKYWRRLRVQQRRENLQILAAYAQDNDGGQGKNEAG